MRAQHFKSTLMSLCLIFAIAVVPTFTVSAQTSAQKHVNQPTDRLVKAEKNKKVLVEPLEEDTLLSDAEMEKVEGGNPAGIAIGVAALAFAGYAYYKNRKMHQRLLEVCKVRR